MVFVSDLEKSVLRHEGDNYRKLQPAADVVVNSILRVRRLLKQKRVTDAGGKPS